MRFWRRAAFAGQEVGFCPRDAVGAVTSFLHQHWRPHHALAVNRTLLDWQHLDARAERYNFVVARTAAGEIDALLGFIPTSQFDAGLDGERDIWLAIWKVRDGVASPGLGLALLSHLVKGAEARSISAIGLSARVIPIYRCLGFTVGKLDHYYLVNRQRRAFSILGSFDGVYGGERGSSTREVVAIGEIESLGERHAVWRDVRRPRKSMAYAAARYGRHPFYAYEFLAIREAGQVLGVLVVRTVEHAGSRVLRVVDFFGEAAALAGCGEGLQQALAERGAEYIDFYCHGLPAEVMAEAGFVRRTNGSGVVVPNYFEPFEQRNVELDFAFKRYREKGSEPFVLFKGDSDQDRPSVVPASGE